MPNTDFDGDGRDDILWRERDFDLVGTWLATDTGGFTDNSANSLIGVPSQWNIWATGDFNNDGHDDLAWVHSTTGMLGTWQGQDDGGFVIRDGFLALNGFTIVGSGDFDANGYDELVVMGFTGGPRNVIDIIFSYGAGDLSYSMGPYGEPDAGWNVIGIGDFDGDGRDDILWRHTNGTIGNWLSSPAFNSFGSGFIINDASLVHVPSDWQVVGTGDFNGDGSDDILWRHSSGLLGNWLGTDTGVFAINDASLVGVPLEWQVVATGDYDGDGMDDLLWRNVDNGALGTWLGNEGGVFTVNPEPLVVVPSNWLIQPNPTGAGEWD